MYEVRITYIRSLFNLSCLYIIFSKHTLITYLNTNKYKISCYEGINCENNDHDDRIGSKYKTPETSSGNAEEKKEPNEARNVVMPKQSIRESVNMCLGTLCAIRTHCSIVCTFEKGK